MKQGTHPAFINYSGTTGHVMRKPALLILLILIVAGISGCIWPVPHTSERSPELRGRVVDAVTHLPVEKATVALHDHPAIMARTDNTGVYHIRATHNIHLFTVLGICSSEFPMGKYYSDELDISHPLYEPCQINARRYLSKRPTNGEPLLVRDILLAPVSKQ